MNSICRCQNPEGALRLQTGGGAQRNPCNDGCDSQNPERVTDLSYLRHLLIAYHFAGVRFASPLPMLYRTYSALRQLIYHFLFL